MFGLKDYIIGTLVVAATATGVWGKVERERAAKALVQVTHIQTALKSCGVRLQAIIDDVESDNAIDTVPDSDLVDVPPEWLLGDIDANGN